MKVQQLTVRQAEAAIRMTAAQAQTVQRIQQLIHLIKKMPGPLEDRAFLHRKKLRHNGWSFLISFH